MSIRIVAEVDTSQLNQGGQVICTLVAIAIHERLNVLKPSIVKSLTLNELMSQVRGHFDREYVEFQRNGRAKLKTINYSNLDSGVGIELNRTTEGDGLIEQDVLEETLGASV